MGKRRIKKKPRAADLPSFDRRGMERASRDIGKLLEGRDFASVDEANAFLQEVLAEGGPPPAQALSPLEQAQDLMYEAWDSTGKRRVKLARQALAISEDCADAYVLLAEEADSLPEANALFEQGVKAGERALGPEAFEEDAGHFWGILETRPYMRARAGLAECLSLLGQRREAIAHYQDMLRLNPGDNQGVRYRLVNLLLEEGEDEALGELLKRYEDDATATWAYSRALWRFRQEGASAAADEALRDALKTNPFVPAYLLGKKRLPKEPPAYIGFGDDNEAVEYAFQGLKIWSMTEGALSWLASRA
jgi:tetratricopeptide (TPR) repeat protein